MTEIASIKEEMVDNETKPVNVHFLISISYFQLCIWGVSFNILFLAIMSEDNNQEKKRVPKSPKKSTESKKKKNKDEEEEEEEYPRKPSSPKKYFYNLLSDKDGINKLQVEFSFASSAKEVLNEVIYGRANPDPNETLGNLAGRVVDGVNRAVDGMNRAVDGMNRAVDGVVDGVNTVAVGVNRMNRVADGVERVATGWESAVESFERFSKLAVVGIAVLGIGGGFYFAVQGIKKLTE